MKKIFTPIAVALLAAMTYTAPLSAQEDKEYTDGVFVLNEGWYGHENASINYLNADGSWDYRVLQQANGENVQLGCTGCYATIADGRMYIVSKQEQDPGATVEGARLTVCDTKTMKRLAAVKTIGDNADGRAFLAVPELHRGYASTSNGVYVFDLDTYENLGVVTGTENASGSLYNGQMGSMIYYSGMILAVNQDKGLVIINPESNAVEMTLNAEEDGWAYGSIVQSKDGQVWLSVASTDGMGSTQNYLRRFNPETLQLEKVDLPDGINAPANSWYAWTPDCFCASTKSNCLYWNGGTSSWFSAQSIYKYDIDANEFSQIINLANTESDAYIYGACCRVHPETDDLYIGVTIGAYSNNTQLRVYSNTGELKNTYAMTENYWFPELPVFPASNSSTGIREHRTTAADAVETARYDTSGHLLAAPVKGINIIQYSDGTTRKVVVK